MSGTRREELKLKIKSLEDLLDSGASSITEDGQTTTFDREDARRQLLILRSELNKIEGRRSPRPIMGQIDISAS